MEIKLVDTNSPEYKKVLTLRNDILRKPIGLNLDNEDLSDEKNQYIIVAENNKQIIACVLLKVIDKDTIQIRQMAVSPTEQKKGRGSMLMVYAENFCKLNEYYQIVLHARTTAVNFYKKLNYQIVSDEFIEVGIPHFIMRKKLR